MARGRADLTKGDNKGLLAAPSAASGLLAIAARSMEDDRPHEAIGLLAPMVRYLAEPIERQPEPHLSDAESIQIS